MLTSDTGCDADAGVDDDGRIGIGGGSGASDECGGFDESGGSEAGDEFVDGDDLDVDAVCGVDTDEIDDGSMGSDFEGVIVDDDDGVLFDVGGSCESSTGDRALAGTLKSDACDGSEGPGEFPFRPDTAVGDASDSGDVGVGAFGTGNDVCDGDGGWRLDVGDDRCDCPCIVSVPVVVGRSVERYVYVEDPLEEALVPRA